MTRPIMANYLRSRRRKAGLSQRELARVLGFLTENQVGRHERGVLLPTFLVAISLEIVFRASTSELFPGVYETVRQNVEERLDALERELQESSARGRKAALIARKLEWLWERRNPDAVSPIS